MMLDQHATLPQWLAKAMGACADRFMSNFGQLKLDPSALQ
jgi:hypothetical protein